MPCVWCRCFSELVAQALLGRAQGRVHWCCQPLCIDVWLPCTIYMLQLRRANVLPVHKQAAEVSWAQVADSRGDACSDEHIQTNVCQSSSAAGTGQQYAVASGTSASADRCGLAWEAGWARLVLAGCAQVPAGGTARLCFHLECRSLARPSRKRVHLVGRVDCPRAGRLGQLDAGACC